MAVTISVIAVAVVTMFIPTTHLTANFPSRETYSVDIGVGVPLIYRVEGGLKIPGGDTLRSRPSHVSRDDCA